MLSSDLRRAALSYARKYSAALLEAAARAAVANTPREGLLEEIAAAVHAEMRDDAQPFAEARAPLPPPYLAALQDATIVPTSAENSDVIGQVGVSGGHFYMKLYSQTFLRIYEKHGPRRMTAEIALTLVHETQHLLDGVVLGPRLLYPAGSELEVTVGDAEPFRWDVVRWRRLTAIVRDADGQRLVVDGSEFMRLPIGAVRILNDWTSLAATPRGPETRAVAQEVGLLLAGGLTPTQALERVEAAGIPDELRRPLLQLAVRAAQGYTDDQRRAGRGDQRAEHQGG